MNESKAEAIQTIVKDLIEKVGFPVEAVTVDLLPGAEASFYCSVRVAEGQNFLIGQYGMNLAALQHLVRILARKQFEEKMEIIVDINDYYLEKKQLLGKEAEQALKEVLSNNISVTLRPMLPYERKIVHALLSTNASVVTESVGAGDARRVVVRPRSLSAE